MNNAATPNMPLEQLPKLSADLKANVEQIKTVFFYPENKALIMRDVFIPYINQDGILLFLEGAVNTQQLEEHVVGPLIAETAVPVYQMHQDPLAALLKSVLSTTRGKKSDCFQDIVHDMLHGNTILLLNGQAEVLTLETPGFQSRAITEPTNENVLRGPKEAFIESAAVNRSLIRKQLRDHRLMIETIRIGELSLKDVSVIYLQNIADPELVKKVKEKLSNVKNDLVQSLLTLEQDIEERSYSLLPMTLLTERPDRACAFLHEGHIVLLMDNSPMALVVPVTFWSLFHTSEDMNLRWPYGNFIRIIRFLAVLVALMTPSIYLAVSTFHEEMLPTDLLLAIAATRERVPFPAFVEVMIMEITFELVREAGIRIPRTIGPTIGIVGALILGQAAVEANLISPILVIIVAMTGLSSFIIPEISFNYAVRIMRFFMLFSANFMGFFGIALVMTCMIGYMVSFHSFGVPFLSPLAPYYRSSNDLFIRPPLWKQWLRPFNLHTKDPARSNNPEGTSKR